MSDDLIARLSADLKPVRRYAILRLVLTALAVGALVAAIAMLAWLGLRADLMPAMTGAIFWVKSGYTAGLGLLGGVMVLALARPDGRIAWPWVVAAAMIGALGVAAAAQLAIAAPADIANLVLGGSSLVCPWYIVALSLPILVASLAVMRRMAPRSPTLAGLATGLMSGGVGAWVYSFHCGENGLMFLLLWYGLGIAVVALLGMIAGRYVLRW